MNHQRRSYKRGGMYNSGSSGHDTSSDREEMLLPLHMHSSPSTTPPTTPSSSGEEDSENEQLQRQKRNFWRRSNWSRKPTIFHEDYENDRDFTLPTWEATTSSSSHANPQSPSPVDDQLLQDLQLQYQQQPQHLVLPTSVPSKASSIPTQSCSPSSSFHAVSSSSYYRQRNLPLLFIGFVLVGIMAVFTAEMSANHAAEQVHRLEQKKVTMDDKIHEYEKDIRILEREISAMDLMIQKQQDLDSQTYAAHHEQGQHRRALNEMKNLQNRLKRDAQQAVTLKHEVQTMSKADIKQKYGNGPHRVEIELVFPDIHFKGPTKFIIELAPSDLMPHSIHTFLEMVQYGLLDGCSFILNALHVVKAAPLPYDGSSAAEKAKAFSAHGLESVAFKEYNDAYPHKKYTVGFAADGSPSFYINTEDNSEIHVGDPCFGRVVEGFDAIRRLEASPTRNGIWFEKRIGIKKATIL